MGTNDHRLFAIDAKTGARCEGFGAHGEVAIDPGMALRWPASSRSRRRPRSRRGVVIVGSSISDNVRVEAPKGTVRAFDARTGKALWVFDPLQRAADGSPTAGHANVWAPISVDEASGLVYLPTSSPSPDFYGSLRPGEDKYANSVVALDALTGKVVWSFQTVHHDLWDYDLASQPALSVLDIGGAKREAVFQGTKQGLIFALDRASGVPLFPVEERPVPKSDVPGETASPTQPVPVRPPALVPPLEPSKLGASRPSTKAPARRSSRRCATKACSRRRASRARRSTLHRRRHQLGRHRDRPRAANPRHQHDAPRGTRSSSSPRDKFDAAHAKDRHGDWGHQRGAPYGVYRDVVLSPVGAPCNAPPGA